MFRKIGLLVRTNQYESKQYFSNKFAEAFHRAGIDVTVFDAGTGLTIDSTLVGDLKQYDFFCSFNRFVKAKHSSYFWENSSIPFVSFLVDPIFYNRETVTTAKGIATCVDWGDFAYASSFAKDNLLFMPHAIEPELKSEGEDRIYPVILLGSCYDPDSLRAYWRKNLSPELSEVVEEAVQHSFNDINISFVRAVTDGLKLRGLAEEDVPFDKLCYYVDYYMRGYDRIELIRQIKDIEVHVFGGTCWRSDIPAMGWNRYFGSQRNVIIHPAVSYKESLSLLKKSKICLNSVPTLRNGSHERVFASYACGALPISSDNLFWREEFGENIVLYPYGNRGEVTEKIKELLADDPKRESMIERGREKVFAKHTWDHRVSLLVENLPRMLASTSLESPFQ